MHILKIKTLDKGWHDKDSIMLHACFQLLVDFVEKEPTKSIDWDYKEDTKHAWFEIQSLYKWWREERPNRKDPIDSLPRKEIPSLSRLVKPKPGDDVKYARWKETCDLSDKLDKEWYEEDQVNLHSLIDIRGHLWT